MRSVMTVAEASGLILAGRRMFVSGDEALLRGLPQGDWIGGTTPYFMTEEGGLRTDSKLQIALLPRSVEAIAIRLYSADELAGLPADYPANGLSYITIPAFTNAHQTFAKDCSTWHGIFDRPLVGWIAGVALDQIGRVTPKVFNGQTGEVSETDAIVMHIDLPNHLFARANLINIFTQGQGDVITFPAATFDVTDCFINGRQRSLAEYVESSGISLERPLVASYAGAMVNVCFRSVDGKGGHVSLYGPVFPGIEYRFANPVDDYEAAFCQQLESLRTQPVFACNCILNYVYGKLEGKRTGSIVGPITFGEIAYMLLNQTLVYVTFEIRQPGSDQHPTDPPARATDRAGS